MQEKAMDSLVNFFERANLVVFGVVLATASPPCWRARQPRISGQTSSTSCSKHFDSMLEVFRLTGAFTTTSEWRLCHQPLLVPQAVEYFDNMLEVFQVTTGIFLHYNL